MTADNITLYCNDISKNSVHCNRYITLKIPDVDMTVKKIIADSEWKYKDGNTYCEEHK